MSKWISAVFALLVSWPLVGMADTSSRVFVPSESELHVIRQSLSREMLDPESTIVSDVVAAHQTIGGDQMAWVCGKVRGKNALGGYSQPTPFMGALIEPASQQPDFLLIGISGQDAAEQARLQTECLSRLE